MGGEPAHGGFADILRNVAWPTADWGQIPWNQCPPTVVARAVRWFQDKRARRSSRSGGGRKNQWAQIGLVHGGRDQALG